jgi:dipeptidyl aminopeptidase/acylaminoacyl peptidase
MQPEDLATLSIPSDPRIHPDGRRVAFVVTRMDMDDDRYLRRLWLSDGEAHPFTAGPHDSSPRWSPDGTRLAFLRKGKEKDARPQVAVMAADGGEAEVLTNFELGVEELAWSPDGTRICVVAIAYTEEWKDLSDEQRSSHPRRLKHFPYRFDNLGWLHDRRRHLWLIDPEGGKEPECITPGDFDETAVAWHPGGGRIAFVSDRHPRRGMLDGIESWEIDLTTGAVSQVADRGGWTLSTYRPDGVLHLLGHPEPDYPRLTGLWRSENGGWLDVSGRLDRSIFSYANRGAGDPCWVGDLAVCHLEDRGRMAVIGLHADGSSASLVGGDRVVSGFDITADGSRLVFTASSGDMSGEVYESIEGNERALTHFSEGNPALLPLHHWTVPSEDVELDVFAVLPEGDGPFPAVLNIHGGPATQYGFGFFDEFQAYAGAGLAVVACNPRGSSGSGLAFQRAVMGDGWGRVDMADIRAALDSALDRFPQLDRNRLGIMGGSYGGFLTAWAIAKDHRFSSAVVERALISFPSFAGTSDIAVAFPPNYTQSTEWGVWWDKSPLAIADQIRTPTLIIHSENDLRCPIEQAEQLFLALLRSDVEVEFLRFPGEGHEMSRSGKPSHRLERFRAIVEWHRRNLSVSGASQPVAN